MLQKDKHTGTILFYLQVLKYIILIQNMNEIICKKVHMLWWVKSVICNLHWTGSRFTILNLRSIG